VRGPVRLRKRRSTAALQDAVAKFGYPEAQERFGVRRCRAAFERSQDSRFTNLHRSFLRLTLLISCLLICGFSLVQAAAPAGFEMANQLYDKGDFQGARTAYEALAASGSLSANLFFNLGNADYRLGKKGEAFVAYELALAPAHPEAKANLTLLRDETGARLFTPSWSERAILWPENAAQNHAAWFAAAAFWVLCFSFTPLFAKRRPAWIPAVFALLVLGWCGSAIAWRQSHGGIWIVRNPEVTARVAPADSSEKVADLPMGSHVQLLLERGPWLYVVLPNTGLESRGWVNRSAVEPIAIRTP